MLRASWQLWQSLSCASNVLVRQRDQKGMSNTHTKSEKTSSNLSETTKPVIAHCSTELLCVHPLLTRKGSWFTHVLVDDTVQGMISYQRPCFDVFWFVPVGEVVLLVLLFDCHCMMISAAKFKKKNCASWWKDEIPCCRHFTKRRHTEMRGIWGGYNVSHFTHLHTLCNCALFGHPDFLLTTTLDPNWESLIECASCQRYLEPNGLSAPIFLSLCTIDDLTPERISRLWRTLSRRINLFFRICLINSFHCFGQWTWMFLLLFTNQDSPFRVVVADWRANRLGHVP